METAAMTTGLASFEHHKLPEGNLFTTGWLPVNLICDASQFDALWHLHPLEYAVIQTPGGLKKLPRFQQNYGAPYYFSHKWHEGSPVPELIQPILEWAQSTIDGSLNGVLVNFYDAEFKHYIGPHNDSTKNMVGGTPIVTISFGAKRIFRLSQGKQPARSVVDFPTGNGSVFVMPYETNKTWKHQVGHTALSTGRRISVTLRAFDPNQAE